MKYLPAPAPRPLLSAVNPPSSVNLNFRIGDRHGFYSTYTRSKYRRQTTYGAWPELEARRAQDIASGWLVSDIVPELQLSSNLLYDYFWENGHEGRTLRREYLALKWKKAA